MIVPMAKVVLVVPEPRIETALIKLGSVGVMHLDRTPLNLRTAEGNERLERLEAAVKILRTRTVEGSLLNAVDNTAIRVDDVVDEVIRLRDTCEDNRQRLSEIDRELTRLEPVGDFDPETVEELRAAGIEVRLFTGKRSDRDRVASRHASRLIGSRGNTRYFGVLSIRGEKPPSGLTPFPLPARSVSELKAERQQLLAAIDSSEHRLGELATHHLHEVVQALRKAKSDDECAKVLTQAHRDGPIAALTGFCPESAASQVRSVARVVGGAMLTTELTADDAPPTLLSHSRWLRSIQPVYKLIGTLPGYREPDVSLWFLLYLTLFLAILIGDAGYGLVLLLGVGSWHVVKGVPPAVIRLCVLFGVATVIWGAVTGNWFGSQLLAKTPVLSSFVVPSVNVFEATSQRSVLLLCFLLGVSHLVVAHLVKGWHCRRTIEWLGHAGWILVLCGTFYLVRLLVLESPMPGYALWLIGIGAFVAICFGRPQAGLLQTVAAGLGQFPLKATNCFSDLISYIRLFAVGMATFAVAASFNNIAASIGFSDTGSVVLAVVVLFFGHTINLLMAGLAIIVHGVRLNMLEFSGHLDMEWKGRPYCPFRVGTQWNDQILRNQLTQG